MHPTFEQLSSVRNSGPVDAEIQQHLNDCQDCHHQVELINARRVELNALPLIPARPEAWDAIQKQLQETSDQKRQRPVLLAAAGLAALAMMVTSFMVTTRQSADITETRRVVDVLPQPSVEYVQVSANMGNHTQNLVKRSQQLESVIAQLSQLSGSAPSTNARQALGALQDRLAVLDYGLNYAQAAAYSPYQQQQLWERRVNTLEGIVDVHKADLARQGFHTYAVIPAGNFNTNFDGNLRW